MNYKGLLLTAVGCTSVLGGFAAKKQPNVLFCIADDASMWSIGAYGGTLAKTPAIDKLAREGAIFENAFTENPKSAPSRACLVTGMHSWQLKEATNHYCHFPAEFKFYPHILMESGYEVGYTGKGWGPGIYDTEYNPAGPEYNDVKLAPPYKGIHNIDYAENFNTFLKKKNDDKPFCFWLGGYEPHRFYEQDSWKREQGKNLADVDLPPFFPDNNIIRGDFLDYAVEVEWFDRHIGGAVEVLRKAGELDNTIIIVTSDHGMPFPRIKAQLYEEGFHIPFIVYWKGKIKAGTRIEDFIAFPDVAPTIMEAVGVAKDKQMTGKSFYDVLTAKKSGNIDESRDHVLLCKERHDVGRINAEGKDLGYPIRGIRTQKYIYLHNYKSDRWPVGNPEYDYKNCDNSPTKSYLLSLLPADPGYKFYQMAFGLRPEEELYDVVNDPHCMNNLAYDSQYADVKRLLRSDMEAEFTANNDPRMEGKGDVFDTYPYAGKQLDYSDPYFLKAKAAKAAKRK